VHTHCDAVKNSLLCSMPCFGMNVYGDCASCCSASEYTWANAQAAIALSCCRWIVRHEGRPLRGKTAADLPASVRAVTEAQCSGGDVLAFWKAMGFQHDHEMLQEGHLYVLGQEIHMQVCMSLYMSM
jgi:hypothetical protein